MPDSGRMQKNAQERYQQELSDVIPELLKTERTPYRIAVALGVYPGAVRYWLQKNGYQPVDGEWVRVEGVDHEPA